MTHRLTDSLFHRVCLTILSVSVVTILLPLTAFTDELLDNDQGDLTFFAEGKLSEAEDEAEIRQAVGQETFAAGIRALAERLEKP